MVDHGVGTAAANRSEARCALHLIDPRGEVDPQPGAAVDDHVDLLEVEVDERGDEGQIERGQGRRGGERDAEAVAVDGRGEAQRGAGRELEGPAGQAVEEVAEGVGPGGHGAGRLVERHSRQGRAGGRRRAVVARGRRE